MQLLHISCAATAQLICAFVFTYADCWFSDVAAHLHTIHILSVNEKLPPLKFRYFENYKISFKNCSFNHDSGQQQIDLNTFNSSTSPGTMVHVQHV